MLGNDNTTMIINQFVYAYSKDCSRIKKNEELKKLKPQGTVSVTVRRKVTGLIICHFIMESGHCKYYTWKSNNSRNMVIMLASP